MFAAPRMPSKAGPQSLRLQQFIRRAIECRDLFVGGVRTGEVPGTGHMDRILFNEKMEELRRESLLADLHQRIRDVKQGPDGLLYIATDEVQGAILRLEPATATAVTAR